LRSDAPRRFRSRSQGSPRRSALRVEPIPGRRRLDIARLRLTGERSLVSGNSWMCDCTSRAAVRHGQRSNASVSGYCGGQLGSCLPLRDAEKPPLAIVRRWAASGWGDPRAGKASVGPTDNSYAGGETAPMPSAALRDGFTGFADRAAQGRHEPTCPPQHADAGVRCRPDGPQR